MLTSSVVASLQSPEAEADEQAVRTRLQHERFASPGCEQQDLVCSQHSPEVAFKVIAVRDKLIQAGGAIP